MENLIAKLKPILESENLDLSKKFEEIQGWDSLASISIIAMLDADYGVTVTNQQLTEFANIEDFCKFVLNNKS